MAKGGLEGELLGSFRVLGELGRGGMAIVYRGVQESLSRPVAIKVLPFEFSSTPELIKRFHREAEAMATLSHPNIVQIIDRGERDGVLYFVMEFVDGGSLKDLLSKQREMPVKRICEIALQIAMGLEHAHSHGIVHRDLKPANVLVDARTGALKIADFGIASFQQGPESATLTSSHVAMGTLNYMSPEQKLDAKNVDQRTDVYALGVILYEMFTGTLPMGSFDPPSDVNHSVPKAVDAVVLKALKAAPQQRYQKIGELAAELRKLMLDEANAGVVARMIRPVTDAFTAASTAVGKGGRLALVVALLAAAGLGYLWAERSGYLPPFKEAAGASGGTGTSSSVATSSSSSSAGGILGGLSAGASAGRSTDPAGSSAAASTGKSAGAGVAADREKVTRAGGKVELARRAAERAYARRLSPKLFAEGLSLEEKADGAVFEGDLAGAVSLYEGAEQAYRAASKEATEKSLAGQDPVLDGGLGSGPRPGAGASTGGVASSAGASASAGTGSGAGTGTSAGASVASSGQPPSEMTSDPRVSEADRERRTSEIADAERRWDAMMREKARADGLDAKRIAGDLYGLGEKARAEGERRRDAGEFTRAGPLFDEARQRYLDAIARCEKVARQAEDDAKARETAAHESSERERAAALAASKKQADQSSIAAQDAREKAEQAGAPELAPDVWRRATEEEAAGRDAYGAARYEVAGVKLDYARSAFEQAASLAATERARRETERVRLDTARERERAITAGAPERAGAAYAKATDEERAANDLFAQGRAAEARARFQNAITLYGEAAKAADAAKAAEAEVAAREAAAREQAAREQAAREQAAREAAAASAGRSAGTSTPGGAGSSSEWPPPGGAGASGGYGSTAGSTGPTAWPSTGGWGTSGSSTAGRPTSGGTTGGGTGSSSGWGSTGWGGGSSSGRPSSGGGERGEGGIAIGASGEGGYVGRDAPQTPAQGGDTAAGAAGPGAWQVASITPIGSFVPIGKGAGQAIAARGIAADPGGDFFLSDIERGAVTRFGADGRVAWEVTGLNKPYDVALSPDGTILYVAHMGVNRVARLRAADGRRESDWGHVGEQLASFSIPYALGIARSGELYVYDRKNLRVQKIGADGKLQSSISAVGPTWAGVAVDSRNRVYFTERDGVKRHDPAEGKTRPFASAINPVEAVAVAVDERDRVYVCDLRQSRVAIVSPDGDRIREIRNGSDGALRQPIGVAAAGNRVYIVDYKGLRKVHVFEVK